MKRIVLMVGGPAAALLCAGIAGADLPPLQRGSTHASAYTPGKDASGSKDSAANKGPAKPHAAAKATPKAGKSGGASASKASVEESDPYADDEAEGDDGANVAISDETASSDGPPPTPARSTTARPVPQSSSTSAQSSANMAAAVDGPMVMSLMGGNINQLMRGGLMNMCPCASKSTLVQVSKLPKGVSISYVSDDPKVVERLQKMADGVRLMRDAWAD